MCIYKSPIFENKCFPMYIEQINTKRFNFLFYLPIPVLFLGLMVVNYFSTQDVNVEDTLKLFIDQFGVNLTFVILIGPLSAACLFLLFWVKFVHLMLWGIQLLDLCIVYLCTAACGSRDISSVTMYLRTHFSEHQQFSSLFLRSPMDLEGRCYASSCYQL